MSHFAKVNHDGIVEQVIVAEQEFINTLTDKELWVQTSYNTRGNVHILGGTPFRKNYAGIGFSYDRVRDAFIPPKPFQSWTLSEETCTWQPPFQCPNDGKPYEWNEQTQAWDLVNIPAQSSTPTPIEVLP